jgi:hypothetical protein
LTAVGSPIGAVLGLIGLRRTAAGARAGRWAAISAIALGLCGTLALVGVTVGAVLFRDHVQGVGRVEAGECVDVNDDADGVSFDVRDCSDPHQAEVVAAGDFSGATYRMRRGVPPARFCYRVLDDHYRSAARTGQYAVRLVVGAAQPGSPDLGDAWACYFSRVDGRSLTDAIEGTRGRPA